MALTLVHPGDLVGLKLSIVGKLNGIDMTTAAVYNIFSAGTSTLLVTHWVLSDFSAFPLGQPLPATWAWTSGIAPTGQTAPAAPTNFNGSSVISASRSPFLLAQGMANTSAYVPPGFTMYFAVSTTTNGVGTFNLTIMGGTLAK